MKIRWRNTIGLASLAGMLAFPILTNADVAFRIPISQSPKMIDPHLGNEIDLNKVTKQIFQNLVSFGDQGFPEPEIARRWVVSDPPANCLTFYLNDVRFSDGHKLTSADVKNSVLRSIKKRNPISSYFGSTCKPNACPVLRPLSDDSVIMCLKARSISGFLKALASNEGAIVRVANGLVLGTGPFRIVKHTPKGLLLKRRLSLPDPAINSLEFKVVSKYEAVPLFQRGDLDTVDSMQFLNLDTIDRSKVHMTQKYLGTLYLGFQMRNPALKNAKVRRAIADAFDSEDFVKTYQTHGQPAYSYIQAGTLGFTAAKGKPQPKLSESELGITKLIVIAADIHKGRPAFKDAIDRSLAKLNIAGEYRFYPFTEALVRFRKGEGDLIYKGDGVQYYEPASMFTPLISTSNANVSSYSNKKLDELVQELTLSQSDGQKIKIIEKIDSLLYEDPPVIPLYHPVAELLVSDKVNFSQHNMLTLNHWEFPFHKFVWKERSKQ